jgi:hypothetical protein
MNYIHLSAMLSIKIDNIKFSSILLSTFFIVSLLVSGCSTIPTQELSQYRNAFAQVQTASEDILIDFAEVKEKAEKSKAAAEPAMSQYFSTSLDDGREKQPDDIEVRRTALRTINTFNNVLMTLAEGKSVETVRGAAGGFVAAAGNFITKAAGSAVPGLEAITEGIKTLAGEFEKARLREEFEKAVRTGAPVIDKMLAELIAERVEHISLRAAEANLIQVDIVSDLGTGANSVIELFKQFSAPANDDPIRNFEKALNESLKPAEKVLKFKLPIKLTYQVSGSVPAFGKEQVIIAEQAIARVRERVAAYKANIEQFEKLKSALNSYGVILDKTRTTLKSLVDTLDRPQNLEITSEEFFEIAFKVKREVEAFRAARKAIE